jgi:hypothetical protein
MDAADRAMLNQLYTQLKELWREGIHLDFVEGSMTAKLVPQDKRSWMNHEDNGFHAKDHGNTLKRLQEICSPLFAREATILGPLALPMGDGWIEYQAEYGPHGVTGLVYGLKGFVLDVADVNSPRRPLQSQHFRFCLMIATHRDQISEAEFGIDWRRHPAQFNRVLVPVRGLGTGWWHEVGRFNPQSRFVEDPWT